MSPRSEKVGGTRPPCPPPNCAHVLTIHKVCNSFKTLLTQFLNIHAVESPDPCGTLKDWISSFVLSVTARSASASAVAFFRLLDLLSYAHFDILKLTQSSLDEIPLSRLL